MNTISVTDPSSALNYLTDIPLPAPELSPFALESADGELPRPPAYETGIDQTVTVGSQIAEFATGVPAELRPLIANSFLLAQLAANRAIKDKGGGTSQWYANYIDTLANTGWLVESESVVERAISGKSRQLHKEIIPILTLALGTAATASAIVLKVLDGLQKTDEGKPWFTLFDHESQRASANQFQISYAEAPDGAAPRINLACFELDASRAVTRVLFFRFSNSDASLRHFGAKLSMNETVFMEVKDIIQARLAQFSTAYIADIPI